MVFKSPCKDCPDRHVGCHSTCQKYIDAKAIHEQKTKERKKAVASEADIESFEQRMKYKLHKIYQRH